MTYVLQLSKSSLAAVDASLLRSLHLMMMSYDLSKNPGRFRPGAIWVERNVDGNAVYEGPDVGLVPELIDELLESLAAVDGPVVVRDAMARLNLAMIHPFSDGSGRMARCLQTLVVAREQIVTAEFCSIGEYLGSHTREYDDVLATVGAGTWHPDHDGRPWIAFCLEAHEQQARRLLQRLRDVERLWGLCRELAAQHRVPDSVVAALVDAVRGLRLRSSSYRRLILRAEAIELTENIASRDLRALVDADLLALRRVGPRRSTPLRVDFRVCVESTRCGPRGRHVRRPWVSYGDRSARDQIKGASHRPSPGWCTSPRPCLDVVRRQFGQ